MIHEPTLNSTYIIKFIIPIKSFYYTMCRKSILYNILDLNNMKINPFLFLLYCDENVILIHPADLEYLFDYII